MTGRQLPNKVIVFCLPGIGDAMFFTPALAALRRALPSARITALTMFSGVADLLATNPDVDEVRHYDFFKASKIDGLRFIWALRREQFDLSIMTFPSNRLEYNVVNRLVGRRWRAAHRYHHQSWQNLWFLNNIVVTEAGNLHNVQENLRLVHAVCERLGVPVNPSETSTSTNAPLKIVLGKNDQAYRDTFRKTHSIDDQAVLFGFHTYSSTFKNMHRKCWDKDRFVELIQRLQRDHPGAWFLLFSGPSDEEVNQYILQRVDGRVQLIHEPNLRKVSAILQICDLFVGNDSGMTHLAAASGIPVVALYGPTDWQRLHPWTDKRAVIHARLPCMPCFYYSSRPLQCAAGLDYACMQEITVDRVADTVNNLLAKPHGQTETIQP